MIQSFIDLTKLFLLRTFIFVFPCPGLHYYFCFGLFTCILVCRSMEHNQIRHDCGYFNGIVYMHWVYKVYCRYIICCIYICRGCASRLQLTNPIINIFFSFSFSVYFLVCSSICCCILCLFYTNGTLLTGGGNFLIRVWMNIGLQLSLTPESFLSVEFNVIASDICEQITMNDQIQNEWAPTHSTKSSAQIQTVHLAQPEQASTSFHFIEMC